MTLIKFQDLKFKDKGETIQVEFLKNFGFDLEKEQMKGFVITDDGLESKSSEGKERILTLFDRNITKLKSLITKKPTAYIHKYSGIPLIGSGYFGIIDRNSSIIELKPITGCNINCLYCSVDEGLTTKKVQDFLVEKDYLVEQFKKVVKYKEISEIEAHIGVQGDPSLYAPLAELVQDLADIPQVSVVSMDTNGLLLDSDILDKFQKSGKVRINLSINSLDPKMSKIIAGSGYYDIDKIKLLAREASKKVDLLLAPVLVPGYNNDHMGPIIEFAKEIGARVGIQNFLNYQYGRNPAKQMPWNEFFELIAKLEKTHNFKLKLSEADFNIRKTKPMPKPFRKGEWVKCEIRLNGRYAGDKIAIANDRTILIKEAHDAKGFVKVKITRSKHNIFVAKLD